MGKHKLQLGIPDTLNICVLRIVDESWYDPDLPIVCPKLQVQAPGFNMANFIEVDAEFSGNFSACDLGIQTINCGNEFNDLPDRVYVIRYSVSPNDQVYVEYNHMRLTKALLKIKDFLCTLDMGACEPGVELKRKLDEVTEIQQYFLAAKAKAETCRQVHQGIALYNYAWARLIKLTGCKNC